MQINVTFDQSLGSLPAGFVSAIDYVVNYLDQTFSDPVVINVDVGYGEIAGQSLGSGALGESESYLDAVSYSTAVSALKNNESSTNQTSAYSTLPATSPVNGGTLWLTTAQEKALGLLAATDPSTDGYVGFSNSYPFYYGSSGQPASNQYYFIGVALHEFTEIMGRASYLGDSVAGTTSYSIMDLFRYSAAGTRQLGTGGPAYFSIDQGTTDLNNWNTTAGGDIGDWAASAGNDALLAFSSPGIINSVTQTDLLLMNILGWDQASASVISGTVNVSSGQTSAGLVVVSGGVLNALSGGTALSSILSGGNEVIYYGGLASGTVINNGMLYDYGVANGTIVSSGLEVVETGSIASGTIVNSGGEEYVAVGGTASGTTLSGGFAVVVGTAISATVKTGTLYEYGIASGSVVNGGVEVVGAGGHASGTTVNTGGEEYVVSGGWVSGTTLNGGFSVNLGTAIGTKINSGSILYDYNAASGTIVNSGLEVVETGSIASGTIVNSGGEEYVAVGGTARGTTLSGGFAVVVGTAISATVKTGTLYEYGIASGTVVNGGVEVVETGSIASGTIVNSGGEEYVAVGGTASGTTLSGGFAVVVGTAISATVKTGTLYEYGIASGSVVNGGVEVVEAGGTASGTTVNNGAEEYVLSGGRVVGTILNSGFVVIAGTAVGIKINSGGTLYDLGSVSGTIINSGGIEFVESGATADNTSISGGTVEIASGGTAGTVTFMPGAGGTLRLDDSIHNGGLIAGFGLPDQLDLRDISFVSGITSATFVESGGNTSGTLTVTDGIHTAQITLLGQYVTGNFHLQNDGQGGTLVLDPPAIVGNYIYQDGVAHSIANNGVSDVSLLGQYIAGAATLDTPPLDQRSAVSSIENIAGEYIPLVVNRHN